jgi:DNA-binding IclR family transcriptional regulator
MDRTSVSQDNMPVDSGYASHRVETVSDTRDARANPINVLAKAGAVLDALDADGDLTPAEIADRLGEPRSSVYRLLASLESLGFVAPGMRRGTYQLGIKLYQLGNSAVRNRDIRSAALPTMVEVRDATGKTVFLAIRHGYQALSLERIEGNVIVNVLAPGTTGALHVGGVGKVLLAAEPEAFWDEYCERAGLPVYTPHTIATRGALFEVLARVRESGVAISDEDRLLGMAGVAAPIRDHDGRICGAIALSGPRPLILGDEEATSIAQVRRAADDISAALGHRHSTL